MSINVERDELARATRLVGVKGGYRYEMWVEVDDKPLKTYDKDKMTEGMSRDIVRGHIASQEGEVRVHR